MGGGGYFEFKIFVAGIRAFLSQVPFQPAGAETGACYTPFDGLLQGKNTDAFRAGLENAVPHNHFIVFPEFFRKIIDELPNWFVPAMGEVKIGRESGRE